MYPNLSPPNIYVPLVIPIYSLFSLKSAVEYWAWKKDRVPFLLVYFVASLKGGLSLSLSHSRIYLIVNNTYKRIHTLKENTLFTIYQISMRIQIIHSHWGEWIIFQHHLHLWSSLQSFAFFHLCPSTVRATKLNQTKANQIILNTITVYTLLMKE